VRRVPAALFRRAVSKDMRRLAGGRADRTAHPRCTVVRVRLAQKATSISLFVVIGVREGGQDVLLTVKSIGGETTEAWRAVLDESPGIGRASP
jgi:hypothetical protein